MSRNNCDPAGTTAGPEQETPCGLLAVHWASVLLVLFSGALGLTGWVLKRKEGEPPPLPPVLGWGTPKIMFWKGFGWVGVGVGAC